MAQGKVLGGLGGQVEQVTDNDVDENAEVVGVEIFDRGSSGEEKEKELENQLLDGRFGWKQVRKKTRKTRSERESDQSYFRG